MNEIEKINKRLSRIECFLLFLKTVLTFDEVARYTGLSKSYLYKLTSSGGIPCYKPNGKHIYFDRSEIDKWLLRNKQATSEEIEMQAATYTTLHKKGGVR